MEMPRGQGHVDAVTAKGKLGPPVHVVHVQLGLSTGSQQSLLHSSPDEM